MSPGVRGDSPADWIRGPSVGSDGRRRGRAHGGEPVLLDVSAVLGIDAAGLPMLVNVLRAAARADCSR